MAEEDDRNLWDVLGSPKNSDLSSTPGKEQTSFVNGAQEYVMDNPQGTPLPFKATYSSEIPDEPSRNGCDWIEVSERHFCDTLAMETSVSHPFDPSQTSRNMCNGTPNSTVKNGTTVSKEKTSFNEESEERTLKIAAYPQSDADRTLASSDQQDRSSIFERMNRNFCPSVVSSKDDHSNGVSNGESRQNHRVASPSAACLSPTGKQQNTETCGNQETEGNLFERVKVAASTAGTNTQIQISGESVFPFSEKLRRLTSWRDDNGIKTPNTVQPLRMGIEVGNPSTQTPNTLAASFVNGQNSSFKVQRNKPSVGSEVDANVVRFEPVASVGCVTPKASYIAVRVRNGIPRWPSGPLNAVTVSEGERTTGTASTVVVSNAVGNSNITRLQPGTQVIRLKRVVVKDRADGEGAQDNLNNAHLVGPFIAPNPVSQNTYVKTVGPTDTVRASGMVSTPLPHQIQPAPASLRGHSTNSNFQMVFPSVSPAAIAQSLAVNPVVVQCSSVVPVIANNLRGGIASDLSCGERLLPSPELKERRFRPVSPPTAVVHCGASPNKTSVALTTGDVFIAERPSIRRLRSFLSSKCTSDWRNAVDTDMADQSYECALRESANSPDMERFLRCDSPGTVQSSQMVPEGDFAYVNDDERMINALNEDKRSAVANATTQSLKDEIVEEPLSERDKGFKRKPSAAMVRRLEARLPSPVRENCTVGDLYRDPSELTREERALQRAMMQFSVMEMKERTDATKRKERSMKRRLRKRAGFQGQANGNGTHPGTRKEGSKTWLKRMKRKRLWFSQRRRIKLKPSAQDSNFAVTNTDVQQTQVVRRKRKLRRSTDAKDEQAESKRKCVETGPQNTIVQPTDVQRKKTALPSHISTDVQPTKARRNSSELFSQRQPKKEDVADSTSCQPVKEARSDKRPLGRDVDGVSMETKAVKRARLEMEPLGIEPKGASPSTPQNTVKPDRSRRVKTYMLVTSYQGFRDFKPVVLQSRTRGKAKPAVDEAQEKPKASEFPLLVVESVHSKPCKERVIAESEEVQQMVENCLKAHGKWHGNEDAPAEEEASDQDALQEAKKLNVNRNTGETVLHKAARLGYHETVRHHIHHGIDPNAKDNAGWTPLHEACSRGKVDVVKVLAKYGSDVNACSNDGIRPIHDAAEGGHVDVLRVLLSYGADPLLATYSGTTAVKCAKETQTRAFLEGYLEDLGISSCSSSSEGEGCWEFAGSCSVLDETPEQTSGIFDGVPEGESICDGEFEMCDRPHIPTYNLPVIVNNDTTSGRRNYVLLSDLLDQLRMSRALLLKRCRRLDIREMPWSKFLAEIADRSLAAVPKFSPPDSSTQEGVAELVPLNYSVRRLLNIRVECVSLR